MTDVIVIGAGPAGCSAAIQSVRLGLSVRLMDRTGVAGGLIREARLVENAPSMEGPIRGTEYACRLGASLQRFRIPIEHRSVTGIRRTGSGFTLLTQEGPSTSRTVILATGTEPAAFDIPGDAGFVMHSFLDLPADLAGKILLIIGGGEAALDYALHAADLDARVSLLVRGSSTKARGALLEAVLEHDMVDILYDTRPVGLDISGDFAVLQTDHAGLPGTLESDLLLAAVGRTAIMPELPEDLSGTRTTSSATGLFICGDALLGSLGQAGTACGQGLQAAFGCRGYIMEVEGDR